MNSKSLLEFKTGTKIKVHCVECGQNFKKRLCEMGLYDGSEVEVLKNDGLGPILLKIFDSKIALGRGEAEKIMGEEI
ncbi:ferrous iron transport protein A [Patescibacteria group bacterium]|nr:ferrous iron transport protein A [Patescibacteria group bacterium]